jgi:hypothetical protein
MRQTSFSRRKVLWTVVIAPVALAGGGFAWLASSTNPPVSNGTPAPRETRPTLDPANFTGKARRAHEVAREIPGVLDRLRCYCRCEGIGHVSLLSCYTDGHAAT